MRANMAVLGPIRDRVLDNAEIKPGDIVLDVGCGDGLIGFGALGRAGETGRVIFSDISEDLLSHCAQAIVAMDMAHRCATLLARAESLDGVQSESVDVVTTRSVLIYVDDKRAAFEAFYRVLRPGGRISLFEPINRRMREINPDSFCGLDTTGVEELATRVREVFERSAPEAMMGFDETDLFFDVQAVGFNHVQVSLELKAERFWFHKMEWAEAKKTSPNPLVPTFAEAMDQVLTPDEVRRLDAHLAWKAQEGGETVNRTAFAFVRATKPE